MHIVTWNINGLRSVTKKGFADWFVKFSPDLIALQEIKATKDDVTELLELWSERYEVYLHPAAKKGYSGVALMVKKNGTQPLSVNIGTGQERFDNEGRLIWAEFEDFYLLNGYFPNGQRDHGRVEYKLDFSRAVLAASSKLLKESKKGVIICGDVNTAHKEIDLANPKANIKATGFLPHERVFIDEVIAAGFFDAYRDKYPDQKGAYTWWTYRGDCRERNIGWRLDYFFIDKNFLQKIKEVKHLSNIVMSDHCPVEIIF